MAQEIIVPNQFVGGARTQLGSLEEMQAAALQAQAAQASAAQAQALARARLAQLPMAQPSAPGVMAQASPQQMSTLSQLAGYGGPQQLALPAPAAPMTQAGAVNASRAAGNFAERTAPIANTPSGASIAEDVSALRGNLPTGTPAAAGEGGILSQLRNGVMSSGTEGPLSGGLGTYLGAGPMGALKTLGARAGAGTLAAIAPNVIGMGVQAFGPQIENALGLAPGSTNQSAQVGADVGTGAMVGTLIWPGPGTLVGAALGGVKDVVPLASELIGDMTGNGVAQQWSKATNQFNKIITKTDKSNVGKKGVSYLNENYFPAAQEIMRQAKAGQITHTAAVQGMQKLNQMMRTDIAKLKDQHSSGSTSKKNRTAVQIQMGEAMNKLAAGSRLQGAAAQATLNNLAMDPNMAAIAPILQASGEMRNQWGNTMADAYTGAAYLDIPEKRLDAKLSELRQLQQQIQAQQNASSSGSSSLASLAAQVNGKGNG